MFTSGAGRLRTGGRRSDRLPFCPHANHRFPGSAEASSCLCVFVVVTRVNLGDLWTPCVGGRALRPLRLCVSAFLALCPLCLCGSVRIPRALKDPPTTGQPQGTWEGGWNSEFLIPNSDLRHLRAKLRKTICVDLCVLWANPGGWGGRPFSPASIRTRTRTRVEEPINWRHE
jgi:hypothetical protein